MINFRARWAQLLVLMISVGMEGSLQIGEAIPVKSKNSRAHFYICRRVMLMVGGFAIIVLVYAFTGSPQSGFEHVRLRKAGLIDDTQLPVIDEVFTPTPGALNEPHGGVLLDLLVGEERKKEVSIALVAASCACSQLRQTNAELARSLRSIQFIADYH